MVGGKTGALNNEGKEEESSTYLRPVELRTSFTRSSLPFFVSPFRFRILPGRFSFLGLTCEARTLLCVVCGLSIGMNRVCAELFWQPTVLANVTHDMEVANEEAFGPIMTIIKFKTEEEVVRRHLLH